ncbi:ATP-binding protein [Egibacter rhizosphaerae]|uniref:ATP-binding protein n=1 Tax=Egibacter rhizosphaerae TaxID=1670831 RepID=A0A411YII8_9ACTN|nr:ATP-binding protein [Egibacter rhizosphaerae]QBI21125.1 ATP-binding protein [Egibacter rhizosphaerae]
MIVFVVLLFGAVIGALARFILPGRQDLSGSATILAGLIGAGTVGTALAGVTDRGFDWPGPSIPGSVLGAAVVVSLLEWVNRRRTARTGNVPTEQLLSRDEGARLEFKSSARHNLMTGDKDARVELAIARAVSGFANTEGGALIIGVDDEGQPIGLDADLEHVKGRDLDRYELWLHDLLERCLGRRVLRHVALTFDDIGGQSVCRIDVTPADAPAYLRPHTGERRPQFYVRTGNSTRELAVDDTVDYVTRQWPQGTLSRAGVAARRRLARR